MNETSSPDRCAGVASPSQDDCAATACADAPLHELAGEVAACVPALPVMQTQLREAIRTMEESVVEVCSNFMAIAQQARAAIASVASDDESGAPSVSQLLRGCSEAFEHLLQHMERSSAILGDATRRIGDVEAGMQSVAELLDRIDGLACDVYVIALNGSIEAARAGVHGRAFAVVAQHTRQLATNARETGETIRGIVDRVARQATETSQALQQRATEDRTCIEASRAQAMQAMTQLSTAHDRLVEEMQRSQHANDQLASSISRAVTTMQFQDAVSQRVSHVVTTLGEMHAVLEERVAAAAVENEHSERRWLDFLSRQYAMQAEFSVVSGNTGAEGVSSGDLDDNIELF